MLLEYKLSERRNIKMNLWKVEQRKPVNEWNQTDKTKKTKGKNKLKNKNNKNNK